MFSRCLATAARPVANSTRTSATIAGPAMSRYFSATPVTMATKVFVGGISWDTNEASLRHTFGQFGEIEDVHIPLNLEGRSKGFAFVAFSDNQPNDQSSKDCADSAIAALNETDLDGRNVSVREAIERAPREGGFARGGRGGGRGGYGRGGGGGYGRGGGGYGSRRGDGGGYGGGNDQF